MLSLFGDLHPNLLKFQGLWYCIIWTFLLKFNCIIVLFAKVKVIQLANKAIVSSAETCDADNLLYYMPKTSCGKHFQGEIQDVFVSS